MVPETPINSVEVPVVCGGPAASDPKLKGPPKGEISLPVVEDFHPGVEAPQSDNGPFTGGPSTSEGIDSGDVPSTSEGIDYVTDESAPTPRGAIDSGLVTGGHTTIGDIESGLVHGMHSTIGGMDDGLETIPLTDIYGGLENTVPQKKLMSPQEMDAQEEALLQAMLDRTERHHPQLGPFPHPAFGAVGQHYRTTPPCPPGQYPSQPLLHPSAGYQGIYSPSSSSASLYKPTSSNDLSQCVKLNRGPTTPPNLIVPPGAPAPAPYQSMSYPRGPGPVNNGYPAYNRGTPYYPAANQQNQPQNQYQAYQAYQYGMGLMGYPMGGDPHALNPQNRVSQWDQMRMPSQAPAHMGNRPECEPDLLPRTCNEILKFVDHNDFKIIRVVGKGSYGQVYLVENKHFNKTKENDQQSPHRYPKVDDTMEFLLRGGKYKDPTRKTKPMCEEHKCHQFYALKVLDRAGVASKAQVAHSVTENRVLKTVKHPFIVEMHFAWKTTKHLFIAMEFCAGGELFHQLQECRVFPLERARFYTAQVLLALEFIHSQGVIYRDLKPENIVICADGYIKLADFGLAKCGIKDNHSAWSTCGTPEYLSPEVVREKGHGRGVDHWGMGAMLYEMLTGLPPFYNKNRNELMRNIQHGNLEYPANMDPVTKDFLKQLFVKDPHNRLGHDGADAIKKHDFFKDFEFDKLLRKEIEPPFIPKLADKSDVSNFDREFTSMVCDNFDEEISINPSTEDPYRGIDATTADEFYDYYYDIRAPMEELRPVEMDSILTWWEKEFLKVGRARDNKPYGAHQRRQ